MIRLKLYLEKLRKKERVNMKCRSNFTKIEVKALLSLIKIVTLRIAWKKTVLIHYHLSQTRKIKVVISQALVDLRSKKRIT